MLDPAIADDVGVHAGAAVRFSDFVNHQHVEVVDRQARKICLVFLQQLGFALQDLVRRQRVNFGRLVETVLKDGDAADEFAGVDDEATHLQQHVFHLVGGRFVKGCCRLNFAHADDHHLDDPALDGSRKTGVQFDTVQNHDPGGLETVAIHKDFTGGDPSQGDNIHAGADFHRHGGFGDAQGFNHGPLACRRGAIVRPHGGHDERRGTAGLQPVAGGFGDCRNIGDAATTGRDGDFALGDGEVGRIQLGVYSGRDIPQEVRDQILMNAVKFHDAGPV